MEDSPPALTTTAVTKTPAGFAATIFDDTTTTLHRQICEKATQNFKRESKRAEESAATEFDKL